MRRSSESRPNGILDLDLDDGPVITDVYAAEEDQAEVQREVDEQRPHAEPARGQNIHVHIHRQE